MVMKRVVFVVTLLGVVFAHNLNAKAEVLWLDDPAKKTIFEKALADLEKNYISAEAHTRRMMRSVLGIYVDDLSLEYDENKYKIFVDMRARVVLSKNVPKSCKALISKSKKQLFGTGVKEKLLEYFPSVDEKDLRYFIKFRGEVTTYAVKGHGGEVKQVDMEEDIADMPVGAEVIKRIMCTNSVLSDKVLYYKN